MNCANHPDRERVAFCQNCGKPLCQECVRNYGTSILCEQCLALRSAGAPYGGVPPIGAPIPRSTPNPGLAAILGFIPGVGAMYNEQYAKGIVHLVVFAILVSLASDVNGIFGLFIAGWICYIAFEAYQTARAKRDGTPLPNPFGLNDIGERLGFGKAWPSAGPTTPPATGFHPGEPAPPYATPYANWGAPQETYTPPVSHWGAPQDSYVPPPVSAPLTEPPLPMYRRLPTGAIWLIGLGLFFLLSSAGFHIISGRLLVPFLLIGFGVLSFVKRMTATGQGLENDGTDFYRWRLGHALNSSAWMVLIGVIFLLEALHIMRWGSSWPLFLILAGVLMVVRHSLTSGYPPAPPYPPQYPPQAPPAPPVTSTEIVPSNHTDSTNQEGR